MHTSVIIDRDTEEYFEASRIRRFVTRIIELPSDAWDFARYLGEVVRNPDKNRSNWMALDHVHVEGEECCRIQEFRHELDMTREELAAARAKRKRWADLMTTDERAIIEQERAS